MRVGRKRATDVEDLRCDPLVKELLNLCDEQGLAINKVAKKSAVSFQTIPEYLRNMRREFCYFFFMEVSHVFFRL